MFTCFYITTKYLYEYEEQFFLVINFFFLLGSRHSTSRRNSTSNRNHDHHSTNSNSSSGSSSSSYRSSSSSHDSKDKYRSSSSSRSKNNDRSTKENDTSSSSRKATSSSKKDDSNSSHDHHKPMKLENELKNEIKQMKRKVGNENSSIMDSKVRDTPSKHNISRTSDLINSKPSERFNKDRLIRIFQKINTARINKQFEVLNQIYLLVSPYATTDTQKRLFQFDLFSLETNVIEKLEDLLTIPANNENKISPSLLVNCNLNSNDNTLTNGKSVNSSFIKDENNLTNTASSVLTSTPVNQAQKRDHHSSYNTSSSSLTSTSSSPKSNKISTNYNKNSKNKEKSFVIK